MLPAINDSYDFGLLLPSTKTKSVFPGNCKALNTILLDVVSFRGVRKVNGMTEYAVAAMHCRAWLCLPSQTLQTATQLKAVQNKLEVDLYRRKESEE